MSQHGLTVEQHLQAALGASRAEASDLEHELGVVRARIAQLESMLGAQSSPPSLFPVVLDRVYRASDASSRRNVSQSGNNDAVERFKHMTQVETLIQIAKDNDNVLRTAPAKALMIEANKVKGSARNTSAHIFQILRDPDRVGKYGYRFEKIEPGVYRLLPIERGESKYPHGDLFDSSSEEES